MFSLEVQGSSLKEHLGSNNNYFNFLPSSSDFEIFSAIQEMLRELV